MGGQHDCCAWGNFRNVVDETDAEFLETIDDQLVVDDLVKAIDRWFKHSDHPGKRLDRHVDTSAETAGFG